MQGLSNRRGGAAVTRTNHQFRLAARPSGMPDASSWDFTEEPAREPGDGEVLVEVLLLSLDPAMRGWMNDVPSYVPPVGIGEVMRAIGVGRVVESRHPRFDAGDHVTGLFGIQEYATLPGDALTTIDPNLVPSLAAYLNVLGMPGMTAYFGLLEIGRPQPGQTVVVSGAAGAVGATVGQIAKIKGCRAVGIAGGEEKCRMLVDEYGFDAAIDYKGEDVRARLKETCPDRIDVYFDNVGGDILDACLARLARGARVPLCGAISQYNSDAPKGPANYMSLLVNRASMTGFIVFDFAARYADAAKEMGGWMAEGKLKSREDVVSGIETFPDTLLKLFRGENKGKLCLQVAEA
jgi:NADPH-dependent curcumin reductase CurA